MLREAAQDETANAKSQSKDGQLVSNDLIKPDLEEESLTFNSCFDDFKGVVHLEALEMLSRQINVRFEMEYKYKKSTKIDEHLKEIIKNFNVADTLETEDDEDRFDIDNFEEQIIDYISELNTKVSPDRIIQAYRTASHACSQVKSNSNYVRLNVHWR